MTGSRVPDPLTEECACHSCGTVFAFPGGDPAPHFCHTAPPWYMCPACRVEAGWHCVGCPVGEAWLNKRASEVADAAEYAADTREDR